MPYYHDVCNKVNTCSFKLLINFNFYLGEYIPKSVLNNYKPLQHPAVIIT